LANRIALLKQEEMKTWKKIEETKKKTGDILSLKQRNENRLRKRIYDSQLETDKQRVVAQRNYMIKRERVEEKSKVQEAIKLSKQEEAKQAKIQASQNEQKKRHHLIRVEQENRMKQQIVN